MNEVAQLQNSSEKTLRDIFETLDQIRALNNVQDTEWSRESGLPAPRISELRKRAKKRACTVEKILKLTRGLQRIIGGSVLQKAILDKVESATDKKQKIILLVLLGIADSDDESLDLIYGQAKKFAKTSIETTGIETNDK